MLLSEKIKNLSVTGMNEIDFEQSLSSVLRMVACSIEENRFEDSKSKLFIEYITNVKDWSKLHLSEDQTLTDLINILRHIA